MLLADGSSIARVAGVALDGEVEQAGHPRARNPRLERGEILIAIDEPSLTASAAAQLEDVGFSTRTVTHGDEAERLLAETSPCLVLLGASTPPAGGVHLMHRIHAGGRIPVILVAAEGDAADRIAGLRHGAEDYLVAPFVPAELVARVEAVLRRRADQGRRSAEVSVGRMSIDPAGKRVTLDGKEVRLTPREYELLSFMAQHPGRTFSRVEILDAVWSGSSYRSEPSVTVHVRRLRMKVEEDPSAPRLLETVRGFGYRLAADHDRRPSPSAGTRKAGTDGGMEAAI